MKVEEGEDHRQSEPLIGAGEGVDVALDPKQKRPWPAIALWCRQGREQR